MTVSPLDIPVAILAGGLATRLGPLTATIPKALVPVAGKPFLAHQLAWLRRQGISRAVLCLGHLGERVVEEFGDGAAHGVELDYSFDGPVLLGTGGAIKRALPKLGNGFIVLYGDSYLPVSFRPVVSTFLVRGKLGLMTVFRNAGCWDTSNVVLQDGEIIAYDKRSRRPEMLYIDFGLNLFLAPAFDAWPADQPFDLADVMQRLLAEGQLASFEVTQRFYEIGSPQGLAELDELLGGR